MTIVLTSKDLKQRFDSIWQGDEWYHKGDKTPLRIYRAISWVERAEEEAKKKPNDWDAEFIFYWIAFNAAYAQTINDWDVFSEPSCFRTYFEQVVPYDNLFGHRISDAVWNMRSGSIKNILKNRFIFQGWWDFHKSAKDSNEWNVSSEKKLFDKDKEDVDNAVENPQGTIDVLAILFKRLYTMRKQLVHGGSAWNSDMSRAQAEDSVSIVKSLVPLFIDVMMNDPYRDWGPLRYPRIIYEDRNYPKR